MQRQIDLVIEQKDALTVDGDVLTPKYADQFYGIDAAVVRKLMQKGIEIRDQMPRRGESRIFDTYSAMTAAQICSLA